jgi:hypothetical protein
MRADGKTYVPEYATYRRAQRAKRLDYLLAHPRDKAHGRRASYDCGCRCKKCYAARPSNKAEKNV